MDTLNRGHLIWKSFNLLNKGNWHSMSLFGLTSFKSFIQR